METLLARFLKFLKKITFGQLKFLNLTPRCRCYLKKKKS